MADLLLFPIAFILFLLDLPAMVARNIRTNISVIKIASQVAFPDFYKPFSKPEKKLPKEIEHYIYTNPQSW